MTKQYEPRDLRKACAMPREDALWFMEHCADAWEADINAKNKLLIGGHAVVADNAALRQRLEAARWLIETAPHCYGSMTREWETRRSAWLAALAAQARGEKP